MENPIKIWMIWGAKNPYFWLTPGLKMNEAARQPKDNESSHWILEKCFWTQNQTGNSRNRNLQGDIPIYQVGLLWRLVVILVLVDIPIKATTKVSENPICQISIVNQSIPNWFSFFRTSAQSQQNLEKMDIERFLAVLPLLKVFASCSEWFVSSRCNKYLSKMSNIFPQFWKTDFQGCILRFHVNLPGCNQKFISTANTNRFLIVKPPPLWPSDFGGF